MDTRERLVRFFEQHNKDKLGDVDKIVAQYAGKETALFAALVKKYGPEPEGTADSPMSSPTASPNRSFSTISAGGDTKARLTRFFEQHNKDKLGDVDKIVAQYAGKETALFTALVKKYGPEPEAPNSPPLQPKAVDTSAPTKQTSYKPITDPRAYLEYRQINIVDFCKGVGETISKKAIKAHFTPTAAASASSAKKGETSSSSPSRHASEHSPQTAIRPRLTRFFEQHNKAKLADVEKLITAYSGKEEALMVALIKKYGPEPPAPTNGGMCETKQAPTTTSDTPKARLTRFFEQHNKDKLGDVDKILVQYVGKETALFAALVKKYGPEPEVPVSAAPADTPKARLTRFFEQHNKDKLGDVDKILTQYAGKETALFAALVKKYGPEPEVPASAAPADTPKARLTRFFEQHNKDKLGDIEKILTQYAGKETALFAALVKKYGPEPEAPDSPMSSPSRSFSTINAGGDTKARLTRFFEQHNKDKLGDVDKIVAQYAGKETALFAALVKKYGPEPESTVDSPTSPSSRKEDASSAPPALPSSTKEEDGSSPQTTNTALSAERVQILADIEAASGDEFWAVLPTFTKKHNITLPDLLKHVFAAAAVSDRNAITYVQSKFSDYANRLQRILVRYDPEKLSGCDALLNKMKGDEERALWTMANRYGGQEPENTAPTHIVNLLSGNKKNRSLSFFENVDVDAMLAASSAEEGGGKNGDDASRIEGDMFRAVSEAEGLIESAAEAPPGDCSGDDESTYPGEDEHWVRLRFEMVHQNAEIVRKLQKQLKDHISGFQIAEDGDEETSSRTSGGNSGGAELPLAHVLSKNGVESGDLCVTCSVRVSKAFDALWAPVGHYHRNAMLSTVVKEGYLEKADTSGKSWKRRYCRMKDSGIHYFESEEEGQKPKGYKFFTKTSEVLENIPEVASQDRRFFYFGVTVNNTNEHFYMRVGSEAEKQSWVSFIRSALERIKTTGVGGNSRNDPNPARWRARLASLKTQSVKSAAETTESTKELIRMRKRLSEQEPELLQLESQVDLLRAQATEAADQEVVLQRYLDQQYEELEQARHACEARKAHAIAGCNDIIASRGHMEEQLEITKAEVAAMTSDIEALHMRIVELNAEKLREELKCKKVFENYRRSEEALPLATKKMSQKRLYPPI